MALSREIVYIGDYYEQAAESRDTWGRTDLFSTGIRELDDYLGHGYGRPNGYEIVVLFGETGIGKSTVALNMITPAIEQGTKVGLLVLEDDMPDVSNRLLDIMGRDKYTAMNNSDNVVCLPDDAMEKSWNLPELLQYIEDWFNDGVDLILLDHLQFAFENAESVRGENEYIAQRVFMQKLNHLMKRVKKTIILISHVNKSSQSKGVNQIVGSGAIAQAATKVLEIRRCEDLDNAIEIEMLKSRFTKRPDTYWTLRMINSKIGRAYD